MKTEKLYELWLRGESLRSIQKLTGIPHMTVYSRLKREYGDTACNLKTKGLLRILVQEYPEKYDELLSIEDLRESPIKIYSQGTINAMTYNQAILGKEIEEKPDILPVDNPELNPAMFFQVLSTFISLVKLAYFGEGIFKLWELQ